MLDPDGTITKGKIFGIIDDSFESQMIGRSMKVISHFEKKVMKTVCISTSCEAMRTMTLIENYLENM